MPGRKAARLLVGLSAAIAVLGMAVSADAQEKKIKIGVIYDLTGPLAGGGSELQYIGAKIMLDQFTKTGVEGYKIEFARDQEAFPATKWPSRSLDELLEVTFREANIDHDRHPGLLRLIGAKQDLT